MVLNLYLSQEEKLPISSRRDDFAEKRPLVVTLNPSVPQDKLREGSQVWENMRFFPFAEPVLEARSGPKGSE